MHNDLDITQALYNIDLHHKRSVYYATHHALVRFEQRYKILNPSINFNRNNVFKHFKKCFELSRSYMIVNSKVIRDHGSILEYIGLYDSYSFIISKDMSFIATFKLTGRYKHLN